jgi:UDP-N-acetylmuramoyl-L-alanyl-D-glutamate--2,6-diaminopimelate ligase
MSTDKLLAGFAQPETLPSLPVNGITSNSKIVKPGDLFIAQAGLTRHAIDFVPDAVRAGAVAVVYDAQDPYCRQRIPLLDKQVDISWIAVPDLQKVTGQIASRFYGNPSQYCRLVGITGTDGKTSVTHLLVQSLSHLNHEAASIGTLGYGLANRLSMTSYTTPDAITLQSLIFELTQRGCDTLVMEVSSHALEQYRVSGCSFDVAVLTNLGSDHLDYHGTRQHYAKAKSALFEFEGLKARVLNVNDVFGRELQAKHHSDRVITYNANKSCVVDASVKLLDSQMTKQGLHVYVSIPGGKVDIQTRLIGSFNIDNLLTCISVLIVLGYDAAQIEQAMQDLEPIPGRMQFFPELTNQPAVVIDFAHTEQALRACLEAVKDYHSGELYCVFGCGGDRDQSKRPSMGRVAEQLADYVFLTDDNPRTEAPENIVKAILKGTKKPGLVRVIHDRQSAIETALSQAKPQDLVVIAGKGHEMMQIVGDQRLPFSDVQVVKQYRKGGRYD